MVLPVKRRRRALYEKAPTEIEIPPPYTFAPDEEEKQEEEEQEKEFDVDDDAVQLVKALFDTV